VPNSPDQAAPPTATTDDATGAPNHDGETESVGGVAMTHRVVDVDGSNYHLVTAGSPADPAVLLLHGFPESWYAWHHQMAGLAADRFVIAPDLKGYGQSEKRPDTSYRFADGAVEILGLLDSLGIDRFDLVGHDRGAVLADHLFGAPGGARRISRYARLQQSFPKAHGEPRPPHELMASDMAPELFSDPNFIQMVYAMEPIPGMYQTTFNPIDEHTLARLSADWYRPGVADAVPRTFVHTNFDIEMQDREQLIPNMVGPVHLIQGELDPGQHPTDYEGLEDLGENFTIEWIEGAGHFTHLEFPDVVTASLRRFFLSQ
jgi:pimeloyl-ACP methyl ester carboxylesterase